MRLTTRRDEDADVIRARLRALLAQEPPPPGWVPQEAPAGDADGGEDRHGAGGGGGPPWSGREDDENPALPGGLGRHRAPGTAVRLDPGRRGARALWVAGLLAALAVAGWTWLDRPRVEPVTGAPAAVSPAPSAPPAAAPSPGPATPAVDEAAGTDGAVVVSVVGQVVRPGLVTLPAGARVADAVAAAGGLLPEADPASVNHAAVVSDGQQIAVGVPGAGAGTDPAAAGAGAGAGGASPVDLNAATAADLDALPGIGPVLAGRIVDHRAQHGRFTSVEQLDDVPGIGPTTYAELAPLVRV
ncbi:ComEA family DNA-binding protein [Geodermatophilus marinus]|uniref:ComEA family DNA-binding protein n=1 Tax=Geodermatophilus sp. LHW52908 TaxID=2303986 RepID=UPI000E3C5CA1|nr:helix-hairpin-helix domain-containing protein [Geodermatophilus sp. LHW52908]RFU20039.1 helix-hairpin-helix domain-containing protein [Geodermatophilus sp. LHW52908]